MITKKNIWKIANEELSFLTDEEFEKLLDDDCFISDLMRCINKAEVINVCLNYPR